MGLCYFVVCLCVVLRAAAFKLYRSQQETQQKSNAKNVNVTESIIS